MEIHTQCIIAAAAKVTGFSHKELRSRQKAVPLASARQAMIVAIFDLRPDLSLQQIAQIIGRADHSTAIYQRNIGRNRQMIDFAFSETVEAIKREAHSRSADGVTAADLEAEAADIPKKQKRPSESDLERFGDYGDAMKAVASWGDRALAAALRGEAA